MIRKFSQRTGHLRMPLKDMRKQLLCLSGSEIFQAETTIRQTPWSRSILEILVNRKEARTIVAESARGVLGGDKDRQYMDTRWGPFLRPRQGFYFYYKYHEKPWEILGQKKWHNLLHVLNEHSSSVLRLDRRVHPEQKQRDHSEAIAKSFVKRTNY